MVQQQTAPVRSGHPIPFNKYGWILYQTLVLSSIWN
jgi:hypothetical protein